MSDDFQVESNFEGFHFDFSPVRAYGSRDVRGKGTRFFCFSQNRQPHTRDQRPKKALVLSLRVEYTRLRDQKKHTEHERNAKW